MRVKPIPTRPASARSRQRHHYRQTRPPCFSSRTGGEHASRDGISEGYWGSAGSPCSGFNIGVSEAGDGGLACSGLGDSDWGEGMKTTSMSKGSTPENYVRELRFAQSGVISGVPEHPERIPTLRRRAGGGQVGFANNDTAVAQGSNLGVAVPHSHGSCASCRPFSGLEGKQPSARKQSIRRFESGVWTTHDHTNCAGTVEC